MAADLGAIIANCEVDWYEREMSAGRLNGIGVFDNSGRVASACYRVEDDEFVLVAGAGRGKFDITATTLPMFERLAYFRKCKTIRFHTQRRGLVRKSSQMGWKIGEIVMRKEVPNGR